jgi:hypothetical protein
MSLQYVGVADPQGLGQIIQGLVDIVEEGAMLQDLHEAHIIGAGGIAQVGARRRVSENVESHDYFS